MATRTKIYFDGGCRPNPGPIETAIVARGISHVRTNVAVGANDEAEWRALIHAAEFAIEQCLDDVVFIGDSLQVIRQAQGIGKCRSAALRAHHAHFRALVERFRHVGLRHVPRSKNLAGVALQRRHDGIGLFP